MDNSGQKKIDTIIMKNGLQKSDKLLQIKKVIQEYVNKNPREKIVFADFDDTIINGDAILGHKYVLCALLFRWSRTDICKLLPADAAVNTTFLAHVNTKKTVVRLVVLSRNNHRLVKATLKYMRTVLANHNIIVQIVIGSEYIQQFPLYSADKYSLLPHQSVLITDRFERIAPVHRKQSIILPSDRSRCYLLIKKGYLICCFVLDVLRSRYAYPAEAVNDHPT